MPCQHQETLLSSTETHERIRVMASRLHAERYLPGKTIIVGIRRGGAVVAQLLCRELTRLIADRSPPPAIGFLDITFYRDDLDTIGPNPIVNATDLSMNIDNQRIILVDDILFTGRTIRAALNALFDYGRPDRVNLAVLVDRGHRQLPIQPDEVGLAVISSERESIKLLQNSDGTLSVVRRFL